MTGCTYAGCTLLAEYVEDGWAFCKQHLGEHRALKRDSDKDRRWRPKTAIDPVAVERAVSGRPPEHLTRAELLEAVRRLHASDASYSEIADRLRIQPRQVHRYLTVLREQAEAS